MFCSHVRYVCLYVCMYVCMHVCTKSFLKTTTNSLCVCTHLANKADSDSDVFIYSFHFNVESAEHIQVTLATSSN